MLFPVFVNPASTTCMSGFFIPIWFPFPDFFRFSIEVFSFVYLFVRFFLMFSEDLCFGTSFIMISKHASLSSSVVASKYSCSAFW